MYMYMKKIKTYIMPIFIFMMIIPNIIAHAENNNAISKVIKTGENSYKIVTELNFDKRQNEQIDIVLIFDRSAPKKIDAFKESLTSFVNNLANDSELDVKMGVIWYDFDIHPATEGLLSLKNTESVDKIIASTDGITGEGSNIHGAIIKAKEWLDADTTANTEQKYIILVTDFGGYAFTDKNGVSVIRIAKDTNISNGDIVMKYGEDNSIVNFDNITVEDIDKLVRNEILLNGKKADEILLKEIGAAASEFYHDSPAGTQFEGIINAERIKEEGYSSTTEKNAYIIGNQLLDIKKQNYNLITITRDYYPTKPQGKVTNVFADWVEENIGNRYELEKNTTEEIFTNAYNNIVTTMNQGKLTQVLNNGIELNYDSINVEVDDNKLTKTVITNGIGFGELNANNQYPYELKYNETTKKLEIQINDVINRNTNVVLSYEIKVDEKQYKDIEVFKSETIEYKTAYDTLKDTTTSVEYGSITIPSTIPNPNTKTNISIILLLIIDLSAMAIIFIGNKKIRKYNI